MDGKLFFIYSCLQHSPLVMFSLLCRLHFLHPSSFPSPSHTVTLSTFKSLLSKQTHTCVSFPPRDDSHSSENHHSHDAQRKHSCLDPLTSVCLLPWVEITRCLNLSLSTYYPYHHSEYLRKETHFFLFPLHSLHTAPESHLLPTT